MGLFSFGRVPEWSPFGNKAKHIRFVSTVHKVIAANGLPLVRTNNDEALAHAQRDGQLFGLSNLAQSCAQSSESEWWTRIERHLKLVCAAAEPEFERAGFEDLRHRVKLRIYPDNLVEPSFVTYEEIPGTQVVLALDGEERVTVIGRQVIEQWGVADSALFELGLANVWDEGRLQFNPIALEGAVLRFAESDSFFAASHALLLERYLLAEPPLGTLVAIPTRHVLVYCEIADRNINSAMDSLLRLAVEVHRRGSGSISPHIYWRTADNWSAQSQVSGDNIVVSPTPEFELQVLNHR